MLLASFLFVLSCFLLTFFSLLLLCIYAPPCVLFGRWNGICIDFVCFNCMFTHAMRCVSVFLFVCCFSPYLSITKNIHINLFYFRVCLICRCHDMNFSVFAVVVAATVANIVVAHYSVRLFFLANGFILSAFQYYPPGLLLSLLFDYNSGLCNAMSFHISLSVRVILFFALPFLCYMCIFAQELSPIFFSVLGSITA